MNQKIITIASIMLALAFIGIMSVVLITVNKYGSNTSNLIASNTNNAVMSELSPYNEKVVSGDTIIQLINTKAELSDGTLLSFYIGSSSSGTSVKASYGHCSGTITIKRDTVNGRTVYYTSYVNSYNIRTYYDYNATGDKKITNTQEFIGHLVYNDENGALNGIYFTPL